MVRQKKIKVQVKSLTLFIVSISIIAYNFPRFSDLLVYDRQAILCGELWRLLTAPFVHFSASHIFWDVLVFGAAGCAIEAKRYRGFWLVCIISAIIPSLILLLISPELQQYGGLSGLATGAVAYFCLCSVLKTKKNRIMWVVILVSMGAKIVAETVMGFPLFAQIGRIPFRVLPSVHIIGYLGAFAAIIWTWPNIRLDADGLKTAPAGQAGRYPRF
jgi:rhomboid family GlyGly-CTERM serine protease